MVNIAHNTPGHATVWCEPHPASLKIQGTVRSILASNRSAHAQYWPSNTEDRQPMCSLPISRDASAQTLSATRSPTRRWRRPSAEPRGK